jgi:phage terminase large subunit-like protein
MGGLRNHRSARRCGACAVSRERFIEMPPAFWRQGGQWRLEPLFERGDDGRLAIDVDPEFRRTITRRDPLLFALVYLPDYLIMKRPGFELIACSEWHLDLIASARRWMLDGPMREAWVVPRKGAKSTWGCAPILPLWAVAHGHRQFFLVFSYTDGQARIHLESIRNEITGNERLLADFPHLRYEKGDGRNLATAGGQRFCGRGLDSETRGLKFGAMLPDVIAIDDGEPSEARYAQNFKATRLTTLKNAILPLNELAVVSIYGTTTKYGSWAHDVVLAKLGEKTAPWINETEFTCHYYPAILDEGLPTERSLWPQKWAISWLKHMRRVDPQKYAKEYLNRPEMARGGDMWTPDLLHVDRHFESVDYVMTIDVAVSQNATSDETAIAVTGIDRAGQQVCVENMAGGRITGTELNNEIWRLRALNPKLKKIFLEANQGGERWREIIRVPPGMELHLTRPTRGSKRNRFEWLLDLHKRGGIVYRREYRELFEQYIAYPDLEHDDRIDVVEAGAAFHFGLFTE